MKLQTWMHLTIVVGMLVISSYAHAQNAPLARFWLSETITGTTIGPISAAPGTRFKIANRNWIVLTAKPGEVLFSDAATGKHYGPYGFQPQRIIMLGDKAMLFSKIEKAQALPPPTLNRPLTELPASSAPPRPEAPKGWERQPLPGTNPNEHLNRPTPFSLESRKYRPTVEAWFEPLHTVKYDWSLGHYTGNSGQKIESSRFGASGIWKNFFLEASVVSDAKIGGAIIPDGTYLSELNLDNGDGFSLSSGYVHSFVIDDNWNANFGGFIQYERTSFDMDAIVLTQGSEIILPETAPDPEDDTITHRYAFKTDTSSLRLQQTTLGAFGGIDYSTPSWGAGVNLIINLYTDVNTSGSIEIKDDRFSLSAKQTHPVGVAFSGWVSPLNDYFASTRIMVGTEISIRIGIGKRF